MGFAALYPSYELRPTNFAPFLCILCGPDALGCSEQVDLGRVAQQPTRDPSMTQMTFGDAEYAGKRKRTKREKFLAEMEQVTPWSALLARIEPAYPKAGRGRRPYPLETMLRLPLLQQWFGYCDTAMGEALYELAPVPHYAKQKLLT